MHGIEKLFLDFFSFVRFVFYLLRSRNFSNPIKRKYSGTIAILANGPSLKEVLPYLETENAFKEVDFCAVNFFATNDIFYKVKPKHYFLTDSAFFIPDSQPLQEGKIHNLFSVMQDRIDWELNLYVPIRWYQNFIKFRKITNQSIHIIRINCNNFNVYSNAFKKLAYFLYTKGLAMPSTYNVSIGAIYASIGMGYKNILLYGVDHTHFLHCFVDANNKLFYRSTHFYDNSEHLMPVISGGKWIGISENLNGASITFKSHEMLAGYADSQKVNVINCTQCSLIDSYVRISGNYAPQDIKQILQKFSKW